MRLTEALNKIKQSISIEDDTYEIKLIKRKFQGISKYIAVIAVISKEGLIDDDVIEVSGGEITHDIHKAAEKVADLIEESETPFENWDIQ